jgi:hypothetical protein
MADLLLVLLLRVQEHITITIFASTKSIAEGFDYVASLDNEPINFNETINKINWYLGAGSEIFEKCSGITRVGTDFSIRFATQTGRVFYGLLPWPLKTHASTIQPLH